MTFSLREVLQEAEKKQVAVGHFNISDITALKGIMKAARELNVPVIIGTSEGEAEFIGFRQAAALVKSLREEHPASKSGSVALGKVFLNADHFRSLENVGQAVDAGYDSIIFDAANLSLEENIKKTKEAVGYIKSVSASRRTDILVEGELGYIGTSSKILEEMPHGAAVTETTMTKPEEAKRFVEETGVDLFAPAVGNIHGIVKDGEPRLDIRRIAAIKQAVNIPLVLHGGSGVSNDDFRAAIAAGISVIHINTEIRIDWREGLQEALEKNPEETTPYKLLPEAEEEIYETVLARLKLFNNLA